MQIKVESNLFSVLFILNLLEAAMLPLEVDFLGSLATVISSILISHFFFHLCQVQYGDNMVPHSSPSKMSSLNFAGSIVGNLGAPLHNFFTQGKTIKEEGETVQFSSGPLAVGLNLLEGGSAMGMHLCEGKTLAIPPSHDEDEMALTEL